MKKGVVWARLGRHLKIWGRGHQVGDLLGVLASGVVSDQKGGLHPSWRLGNSDPISIFKLSLSKYTSPNLPLCNYCLCTFLITVYVPCHKFISEYLWLESAGETETLEFVSMHVGYLTLHGLF